MYKLFYICIIPSEGKSMMLLSQLHLAVKKLGFINYSDRKKVIYSLEEYEKDLRCSDNI